MEEQSRTSEVKSKNKWKLVFIKNKENQNLFKKKTFPRYVHGLKSINDINIIIIIIVIIS